MENEISTDKNLLAVKLQTKCSTQKEITSHND